MEFLNTMVSLIFCLTALFGIAATSNETIGGNGFEIDTVGKSGKIVIKAGKKLERIMTIQADKMVEYTADGTTKAGQHALQTFAKTDFTFSNPMNVTVYNLSAIKIVFTTTMTKKLTGTMKIDMIIFKEDGNITVESGEVFDVKKGAVKFNIDIKNWTFCDPCKKGNTDQVGKFLDLTMEIKGTREKTTKPEKSKKQKGKKGKSKAKTGPDTYDMGNGELIVSHLVKIDKVWMDMPDGFPAIEQKGSKTLFTFRFEKFNSSVYYDPIGQSSDAVVAPTPAPTPKSGSIMMKASQWSLLLASMMLSVAYYML